MVEIGKINKLTIKKVRDSGAHLDGGESGDVLLPLKDVPENCQPGDEMEIFVYQNRDGHLRASTKKPCVTVGQFAKLRVAANGPTGSFLRWGLEKDLFAPKSEQQAKMEEGKAYMVYVFLDEETNRIAASSKLDKFLDQTPPNYKEGQEVDLIILEQTDLGYRAIVNHAHEGMLYKSEVFKTLFSGQEIKGYIKKVRDDQKIDLILQKPGYQGVDDIAQNILKIIKASGGRMAVTDKTAAEDIYALFGVSKKTFKKAIGALYRKKLIVIDTNGVKTGKG
ncbi:MAG: GntR family transcriptional regulator [Proteobacteria bacterium]|nr:GntR family transcriptional regulator [Pseudomonadota bacterium]MBU1641579.1 GntR family transcriptional regulator [Pseudomonadota bacterium]